jgi:hypothetical protein
MWENSNYNQPDKLKERVTVFIRNYLKHQHKRECITKYQPRKTKKNIHTI